MNSRSIRFSITSPYPGWHLSIDQGRTGAVLVQVVTGPRSINGLMTCAMMMLDGTAGWDAAVAGLHAGPGEPLENTLTAILADLPEQAAVYQANPAQQAHIGLIAAAGVHAMREWKRRYPDGVPAFEVVGMIGRAAAVDPGLVHLLDDRSTGDVAVLRRRNRYPHNEQGTTDDFYG